MARSYWHGEHIDLGLMRNADFAFQVTPPRVKKDQEIVPTLVRIACCPPAMADEWNKQTVLTISGPVEVPGIILPAGTYVFRLADSPGNRHIVQIMSEKMDHVYALTFAIPTERLDPTDKTALAFHEASSGRPQALRKWFWPGDTIGQEFIYPKNQADRISLATKEKVPEGNLPTVAERGQSPTPDNANGLSLEATAEKKDSGVLDARAAEPARAPEPETTVIAQNAPLPPPPQRPEQTPQSDSTPVQSASNDTPATTLPQTASPVPLMGAIGLGSLALAMFVGAIRRSRSL